MNSVWIIFGWNKNSEKVVLGVYNDDHYLIKFLEELLIKGHQFEAMRYALNVNYSTLAFTEK